MTHRPRRGFALIDVLVAILLLALTGTALVTLLGQTAHTMQSLDRADAASLDASREMDWLASLSRAQLVGRVGRSHHRSWTLDVVRAAPALFDVTVAASDTSAAALGTTLYRPDTIDASR
ncbi:MAG TPA: hypothetical protein VHB25_19220 [Gemmatimonadaceae bacterium]|nr:hypothetical protein [Gemmatimonadaceae bacterium]